jgi:hypothetical protein
LATGMKDMRAFSKASIFGHYPFGGEKLAVLLAASVGVGYRLGEKGQDLAHVRIEHFILQTVGLELLAALPRRLAASFALAEPMAFRESTSVVYLSKVFILALLRRLVTYACSCSWICSLRRCATILGWTS